VAFKGGKREREGKGLVILWGAWFKEGTRRMETGLLVLVVVGGFVRFVFVHSAVAFGT